MEADGHKKEEEAAGEGEMKKVREMKPDDQKVDNEIAEEDFDGQKTEDGAVVEGEGMKLDGQTSEDEIWSDGGVCRVRIHSLSSQTSSPFACCWLKIGTVPKLVRRPWHFLLSQNDQWRNRYISCNSVCTRQKPWVSKKSKFGASRLRLMTHAPGNTGFTCACGIKNSDMKDLTPQITCPKQSKIQDWRVVGVVWSALGYT